MKLRQLGAAGMLAGCWLLAPLAAVADEVDDVSASPFRLSEAPPELLAPADTAPTSTDDADTESYGALRTVPYDPSRFSADPHYGEDYDAEAQRVIYGGKSKIENSPRPLFEFGYPQYEAGPLPPARDWFGAKNLARPQFLVFGDWRSAIAANDAGDNRISQLATRLNLDFDLAVTSTERFHWSMRPLDRGGRFTRYQFSGQKKPDDDGFHSQLNGNLKTAFFEGDLAAMMAGFTGRDQHWDLPVTAGFVPFFVQNGIWMNDAMTGAAFTIPARNSAALNISNMDITVFGAGGIVASGALRNADGTLDDSAGQIVGTAIFAELLRGYLEAGYGYTRDTRHFAGGGDFGYHNLTLAFTRRYAGVLSNSVRAIVNFGQKPPPGAAHTADGYVLLVENSFVTAHELTLVPYLNLWFGEHHPQSLARAADAGGLLANTGINFQTDGLTGFPNLDASAQDTLGGALGIEYLFSLDRQVVAEFASVIPHGNDDGGKRPIRQSAFGLRYQQNLTKAWIMRTDFNYGLRSEGQPDFSGIRLEFRRKF
ncbi:hypothetical protein [Solimonas terrae]|uniref:DUF1302 domain-containing protein n=1 Tax=Solimonas terrae TaxID=1396819 RepID=A0A6M2BU88_9GAMM|nr:hypothetical protein [Solimonas terrae]NGY06048.1 hypothetical protein [Solimonas terrae]